MTRSEKTVWARLRLLRAEGYHFRRQAPFKGYYLDFVCFNRRLVVELDGSHHDDDDRQAEHDLVRDAVLKRAGFVVLRFSNGQVGIDPDGLIQEIRYFLERQEAVRPSALQPKNETRQPSPSWGGTDGEAVRVGK